MGSCAVMTVARPEVQQGHERRSNNGIQTPPNRSVGVAWAPLLKQKGHQGASTEPIGV
jgi:hypothetical protein